LKVLALVPARNEADSLPDVVRALGADQPGLDVLVVVSAALLGLVIELVRRRKVTEKHSLIWIVCAAALLGLSLWRKTSAICSSENFERFIGPPLSAVRPREASPYSSFDLPSLSGRHHFDSYDVRLWGTSAVSAHGQPMNGNWRPLVLAFNDPYHDSSFCLCDHDAIVHVELERFTRQKYEVENPIIGFCELYPEYIENIQFIAIEEGDFLAPAVRRILREGKSLVDDARALADLVESASALPVRQTPLRPPRRAPKLAELQRFCRHLTDVNTQICFYGHHEAHAANAFFSSGRRSALAITLDGGGYDYQFGGTCEEQRLEIYGSVYRCAGASLDRLSYLQDTSFGKAWGRVTDMLGLLWGEEGTVMAMAALGDSARFMKFFCEPFFWMPSVLLLDNSTVLALERFLAVAREQVRTEQDRFDMAAALQAATEHRVETHMRRFISDDVRDLCVAGGLFLNCQLLGKVQRWFPQLRTVFIPPAPYDGGISVGGAQIVLHKKLGVDPTAMPATPALFAMGRSYSRSEVLAACREHGLTAQPVEAHEVLELIASGRVCGLFSGAAESGRRALGHRSIIADPRRSDIKDRINREIKHRQWFRPLAPMVLAEHVDQWFECPETFSSPYMSFAVPVKPLLQECVPAIVHADRSARVQTVHHELSPLLHDFLSKWHARTKVPLLVNTSFNDGEPIVETPEDALRTFQRVGLDVVYFIDYGILVTKSPRCCAG
jgi:carbamoyltransferase